MEQFPHPPNIEYSKKEQKIRAINAELSKNITEDEADDLQDDIVEWAIYYENMYPKMRKYALFHRFIGSTPDFDSETIYDDLPGEESFLVKMESLEEKYLAVAK